MEGRIMFNVLSSPSSEITPPPLTEDKGNTCAAKKKQALFIFSDFFCLFVFTINLSLKFAMLAKNILTCI